MVLSFGCRAPSEALMEEPASSTTAQPKVKMKMTQSQAIKVAKRTAETKKYRLADYLEPEIEFDSKEKKWTVFFNHKPPGYPGSHFLVWVNDKTGIATLMPGE